MVSPEITRHVKDEYRDLQTLFDAGDALEGLLGHPGWLHLQEIIEREIATIDRELDSGRTPLSQADYAMAHGRRGGLRFVERAARAIVERAQDELARQQETHERTAEPVPQEVA